MSKACAAARHVLPVYGFEPAHTSTAQFKLLATARLRLSSPAATVPSLNKITAGSSRIADNLPAAVV